MTITSSATQTLQPTLERKHVEVAYTLPDHEAAGICAGLQREKRDTANPVTLFADSGGIVAAVSLSDTTMSYETAVVLAPKLALEEILAHLSNDAQVYPNPHHVTIVDFDATETNLLHGAVPPLDPPDEPVDGESSS